MIINDVPKHEIETGLYSKKTISGLLDTAKYNHRQSVIKSASRNVPLIIGSYIAVCASLSGYSLAYGESILFFLEIYLSLFFLWIPILAILPINWFIHRPTEVMVRQELAWYKERCESNGNLNA